ncbi:ATP-binding cassette domain-containing protein [Patescibacteria group bacterium]|nr:ATP-binding cassette domain-containing protein [Patescibacteria group bacterium]
MIKLDKVSKRFGTGVFGLSNVSLAVNKGEFVFLVGPSGSGKTSIFRLIIREMLPTEGTILVNDWDVGKLPKSQIPHLRKKVGMVFQDLKLLTDRTIFENVILPLEISGMQTDAKKRVDEVLQQVGLENHKDKFPIQLSGGELQRAAIARALVLSPDILLADEATGNLDMNTSWEIIKLLSDINEKGTTVLMATHNLDIVKNLQKRVVELEKGHVVKDLHQKKTDHAHVGKQTEHKEEKENK